MAPFCLLAGSVRLSAVYFLGSLWDHFGIVLGSFWGFFFCPFWAILPIFWPTLGPFLRSFCVFFFADVWCKIEQNRCEGRQTYANFCQNDAKLCQKMSFFACKTRVLLQNPSYSTFQLDLNMVGFEKQKHVPPPPTLDLNRRSNKSVQ